MLCYATHFIFIWGVGRFISAGLCSDVIAVVSAILGLAMVTSTVGIVITSIIFIFIARVSAAAIIVVANAGAGVLAFAVVVSVTILAVIVNTSAGPSSQLVSSIHNRSTLDQRL